jgi:hypothetical protein
VDESKRDEIERLIDLGTNPQTIADKVGVTLPYVHQVRKKQRAWFKEQAKRLERRLDEE